MKTMDAAHGKWGNIYQHFGMAVTGKNHIDCPMCEGKKKLRITDEWKNGDWICVCGHGNGIKLLQEILGQSFRDLAKQIDAITGNSYKNDKPVQPIELSQVQKSINKFKSAESCRNTPAQSFFNNRMLFDLPQGGVKFIAREPYRDDAGQVESYHPALYTIASNLFGEPIKEHITYITKEGLKADVSSVRKIRSVLEYDAECSVKLFQATEILGIGEGIETCLAAYSLYKIPTWATLNTAIMKKFKAPKGVKTLYIFADHDSNGAGFAAAFECGHKNILANNDVTEVVVRWSIATGDFNDMVINGGEANEIKLNK